MDNQELRTLQLLEAIEEEQVSSQRDIAQKLNVSLGLVNSFIRRLAHKGYFKITNIPRNRLKYILTPKGVAEKSRLTYLYIQHSLELYKTARVRLRKVFQDFSDSGVLKIVMFGATDLTEIAFISLQETPIQLMAVVDVHHIGKKFIWGRVQHPDALGSVSFDKLLLMTPGDSDDIIRKLKEEGIPGHKIAVMG